MAHIVLVAILLFVAATAVSAVGQLTVRVKVERIALGGEVLYALLCGKDGTCEGSGTWKVSVVAKSCRLNLVYFLKRPYKEAYR